MNALTRRSILTGAAAASAAVIPMPANATHVSPAPDAAILALAEKTVELIERDASGGAWRAPLNELIDAQARSIDGLLAKARVWQTAADLEIDLENDNIEFDDLHCSIISDLVNWGG